MARNGCCYPSVVILCLSLTISHEVTSSIAATATELQAAELGKGIRTYLQYGSTVVQGAASAFLVTWPALGYLTKLDKAKLTANVGQCSMPIPYIVTLVLYVLYILVPYTSMIHISRVCKYTLDFMIARPDRGL